MSDSFHKLINLTVLTFFTRLLTLLIGIVSFSITAHFLGPDGRGIVVYIGSVAGTIATLINLSIDRAILHLHSEQPDYRKNCLSYEIGFSILFLIFLGLIGSLIVYFLSILGLIKKWNFYLYLPIIILHFVFIVAEWHITAFFQVIDRLDIFNYITIVSKTIYLIFIILFLIFLKKGVIWLLLISLLTQLISCGISFIFLIKNYGISFYGLEMKEIKRLLKEGIKFHISSITNFISNYLSILILGYIGTFSDIGVYQFGYQINSILMMLPLSMSQVLISKISTMGIKNKDSISLYTNAIWYGGIVMIFLYILSFIFYPYISLILGGYKFLSSVSIFRILVVGAIFKTFVIFFTPYLICGGKSKEIIAISIVEGIGTVLGFLLFVPSFGIKGLALGIIFGYIFSFLLTLNVYIKGK